MTDFNEFMEKYDGIPIYLSSGLEAWTNASSLGLSTNTCIATNFSNKQSIKNASQAIYNVCTEYIKTPCMPKTTRATTLTCFTHRQRKDSQ